MPPIDEPSTAVPWYVALNDKPIEEPIPTAAVPIANARRACLYAFLAGAVFGVTLTTFAWLMS